MSDLRRMSPEERTRDLVRRGLPLPLAGQLCEPESCAVPDLQRCPWPFTTSWLLRDGWGVWVCPERPLQHPDEAAPLCRHTPVDHYSRSPGGRHAYSLAYARYLLTIKGERRTVRPWWADHERPPTHDPRGARQVPRSHGPPAAARGGAVWQWGVRRARPGDDAALGVLA